MYSALTYDVMKSYLTLVCIRQENSQWLFYIENKGRYLIKKIIKLVLIRGDIRYKMDFYGFIVQ